MRRMMRTRRSNEGGDTIIEVLFAVAVFAMVAVGSLLIMNQGTGTAQRALEITLVRQQMDAQAETIRFIHQAYVAQFQQGGTPTDIAAQWPDMTVNHAVARASDFGALPNGQCPVSVPTGAFVLDAHAAKISSSAPKMTPPAGASLPPFAQVAYNTDGSVNAAYGLWVEAVPSQGDAGAPNFVDFHIRACWDSPGSDTPVTLGTIVRLYEPKQ